MKFEKTRLSLLSCVLIFQFTYYCFSEMGIEHGTFKGNKLEERINCTASNTNMMFENISSCDFVARINMGVELNSSLKDVVEKNANRFSILVSSETKQEVLNKIVKRIPGYIWKETNGVVNIRPYETHVDAGNVSALDKVIPGFKINNIPARVGLERLVEIGLENGIPLTTVLREQLLRKGSKITAVDDMIKADSRYYSLEELIGVNIRHKITIRDCLNALVLADPPSQWYATKEGDKTLLIITTSQSYRGVPDNPDYKKYPAYRLKVPAKEIKK